MTISISDKKLKVCSLFYLYIPILIWIATWTRWWFALVSIVGIVIVLYRVLNRDSEDKKVTYTVGQLITIILFLVFIGWLCGWGGFIGQNEDFPKHNALLQDLSTRPWPVYYEKDGVTSRLTYYLGQYIVPGTVGKLCYLILPISEQTAFYIAEYALAVWNLIGLFLVVNHLMLLLKNPENKLFYILIFMFAGNLIPFAIQGYHHLSGADMGYLYGQHFTHVIDFGRLRLEYSSQFILLRWVFQHTIPCWMCMGLLYEEENESDFVVFGMPLALFTPFCLIGITPFMVLSVIRRSIAEKNPLKHLKKIFNMNNLTILLLLGGFTVIYYWGSLTNPDKPQDLGLTFRNILMDVYARRALIFTLVTCLGIPVTGSVIALWGKKSKWWFDFGLAVVMLLIFPFFQMGVNNDLASRGSIPALFVMNLLILKAVQSAKPAARDFLIFLCLLSFISNAAEINSVLAGSEYWTHHLENTYKPNSLEVFANPDLDVRTDNKWNYYDYQLEKPNLLVK